MSDPVTTAKVLLKQRDEWKRKYEEELKLWEWIENTRSELIFSTYSKSSRAGKPWSAGYEGHFATADSPREAIRKAMETEG